MTNKAHYEVAGGVLRLALAVLCAALSCGITYGQSGGGSNIGLCTATGLRLTIATADDDLRGGQDNLNIIVFFAARSPQAAANVNKGKNWPNNSVNYVDIPLSQPVSPGEIKALRLVHIPDGSFSASLPVLILNAPLALAQALKSPDNWSMGDIEVAATGNGVAVDIGHHGYHRFTGSDPSLVVATHVPSNICGSGRPTSGRNGNGGLGSLRTNPAVNPGGSGLHPVTGGNAGSKYGTLTNSDVVRMAKTGVSESAIITSIRSNPTRFDISAGGVAKLRQTGISENILREMQSRSADPNNNPKAELAGNNGAKNADDLNPQPYPPKSKTGNQILLPSATQQTLLGTQANSPSGNTNQSALVPAVQSPAFADGSLNSGTRLAGATQVGSSQTMSAPGNSRSSAVQQSAITDGALSGGVRSASTPTVGATQTMSSQGNDGSNAGSIPSKAKQRNEYDAITAQRGVTQDKNFANWANSGQAPGTASSAGGTIAIRPIAITANPNLYVAQACAKDSSFRILFVTGASDGKTLTVGPQFTVWGCSFGNMPGVKQPRSPVISRSQNQTTASYPSSYNVAVWTSQPFFIVDANTVSWSDNAVVVTFPPRPTNHPGTSSAGLVLPAQVLLTRGDGQTTIYGEAGQIYFKPIN